jgi:hypothetical protein
MGHLTSSCKEEKKLGRKARSGDRERRKTEIRMEETKEAIERRRSRK